MTHLKPRSTTVVLYQGDDMDRLAQLQRAASIAERQLKDRERETAAAAGNAREGDDTSDDITAAQTAVGAARDAFDSFVDDAAGRALSVEVRTVGRRRFRDLLAEHPPRMVKRMVSVPQERALGEELPPPPLEVEREFVHDDDDSWGVNTETFGRALLAYRDGEIMTIGTPEFGSRGDVEKFLDDEVSEGDFDGLWQAAYLLNRTGTQDPKALTYSPTDSRSTDET